MPAAADDAVVQARNAAFLQGLQQLGWTVGRNVRIDYRWAGAGTAQFAAIRAVAPSSGVELSPVNVRDAGEIERVLAAFARASNGGLIVAGSPYASCPRHEVIE
jgi:hypothetical protein